MGVPEGLGLATFNALPDGEAVQALLACCASPRWAAEVAAARPFASNEEVAGKADEVLAALDEPEIDAALAGHPRIGERPSGRSGGSGEWSRREQAGVARAPSSTVTALAEGNAQYEARFGHVYLVCASGRSAEGLLEILHQRLSNDPETERAVLRRELAAINRIRLTAMLSDGQGGAA